MKIKEFLEKMDIPYKDINLFKEAFTHPSYANEQGNTKDYERLEFLGDAVLQYHVSMHIFKLYQDIPEGQLTTLRSKLVREESLARFARKLEIGELIYLGAGEKHNGGANRDSVLANVFESFIGAVCYDCGHEYVEKVLELTIYQHVEDVDYDDITDYKTTLQELIQADSRKTVTYELLSSSGPSNAPIFEVAVMMEKIVLGTGKGSSKKRAEQQAAKNALDKQAKTDFHV